jgi:C1A family cysteine protease
MAVGLTVDRAFDSCSRKNSRLLKFKAPKDPDEAGHAASLVGYGPDYFILRNSWGTGWGDRGYAYLSDDYARAAIEDAYGVVL